MQRFIDVIRDDTGAAVSGATVRVYEGDSSTLATLYDGAGTAVGQPLTTNSSGVITNGAVDPADQLGFKAAAGRYRIEASKDASSFTLPDILLGDAAGYDPDQILALAPTGVYHGTAGGTVDAITTTLSPAPASLTDGLTAVVEAAGANTSTTPSINFNSLGAKTIVKEDGQALLAGDIPGAGFKALLVYDAGNDNVVLLNPSTRTALAHTGVYHGTAGGTVDAITTTLSPAPASLTDGLTAVVDAAGANTSTAPTINCNSLGDKTLVKEDGQALLAGDIPGAGYKMLLVYDAGNDNVVLLNPSTRIASPTDGNLVSMDASGNMQDAGFSGTLLAEYEVTGAAVTSIDFTGLDINAHKSYRIELDLVSGTGSNGNVSAYINGDTTDANYYFQYVQGDGGSVIAARGAGPKIGYVYGGDVSVIVAWVQLVDGYMFAETRDTQGAPSALVANIRSIRKTATVSNITQITLAGQVTGMLGVGTKISIYRGDV